MQMSNQEAVINKVEKFILDEFPLARQRRIARDTSLLDNGFVDSIGILEIVTFIESEFNITVSDEEILADHFNSINSLSEFINNRTEDDTAISRTA